jgi:hypothetical protein
MYQVDQLKDKIKMGQGRKLFVEAVILHNQPQAMLTCIIH